MIASKKNEKLLEWNVEDGNYSFGRNLLLKEKEYHSLFQSK